MNDINPIIIELLKKRGIASQEEIREFLSDKPRKTYDPFLLHNLEAGVDFVLSAIGDGKKICIYGDYDADGVTSVTLMRQVLLRLTDNVSYYIPSRFDEGYGLNKEAIARLKAAGTDVILTVDCGSVSADEVEYARFLGMETVVTDHHSVGDRAVDCILINPKQKECGYPFKQLAGVGVAFKFAQGLQQKAGLPKSDISGLLDLVAIGTIGDIVPLTDENRTLVKYGLKAVNRGGRPGLSSLIEAASLGSRTITSENVAYGIVPHINAAGRMKSALSAAEVMMAESREASEQGVKILVESNASRKKIQQDTFEECLALAEKQCGEDDFKLIEADDAHEGIAGIVAGKIKDRYLRPSVIVTASGDGMVKGTGRSTEKINLYELLSPCSDLFVRFGGHAGACGFTMEKRDIPEFRARINAALAEMESSNRRLFEPEERVDMVISPSEITEKLVCDMEMLAPFGNGNEKPALMMKDVTVSGISRMGDGGQHMRFTAADAEGGSVQCILFSKAREFAPLLEGGDPISLYGSLEYSVWNGRGRIQFMISNVKGNDR